MKYQRNDIDNNTWVIKDSRTDYKHPEKGATFAFDTETFLYLDGIKMKQEDVLVALRDAPDREKRERVSTDVWAWMCYDEKNGLFMSNSFDEFMKYLCMAQCKFAWCYNATFDFAQIDYQILAKQKGKWKPHERSKDGKGYDRGQPFTYSSLHSSMGARYEYKLWYQFKNEKYNLRTHPVSFRDFMKFIQGGLGKCLENLDVRDNHGEPVRKLTMDYQDVDPDNLTDEQIAYCENDVKGLYFAVKQLDEFIGLQTNYECAIWGKRTNVMTAGGLAKRELLRFLYPDLKDYRARLKAFQKCHPISEQQDRFYRNYHLYRGGITLVNPAFKNVPIHEKLYRYDVNSEYPYAMANIRDLVKTPFKIPTEQWFRMSDKEREKYECIYVLKAVHGFLKKGMVATWYDFEIKEYVEEVNETSRRLMFEREFQEMCNWYDLDVTFDKFVILFERGERVYAPFVEHYYQTKTEAKKEGNTTLQQLSKLFLNSSYGKLSERSERQSMSYELNAETGAIHAVLGDIEDSFGGHMNVAIGALITAVARCYILAKIREICPIPARDFVYMDTDSIHCFNAYEKADAHALGGLKLEAIVKHAKYIAPKTYYDLEEDELIEENGHFKGLELHSKGLNTGSIQARLMMKESPSIEDLNMLYDYGQAFACLQGINVKGGKALVPIVKYIARPLIPTKKRGKLGINATCGFLQEA